jgi:hypothetical protein
MFCPTPPDTLPQFDLSVILNPAYQSTYWWKYRVPLDSDVNYKCRGDGHYENDYSANTYNITCVNVTSGTYEDLSWPKCNRSN